MTKTDDEKYDAAKIRLLLCSLARNESTTTTKARLLKDIKENDAEIRITTYLDVFDCLFLIDNQPPFAANIRSVVRVKQAEKRHFCDSSLACALLKATPDRLIRDFNTVGFLFEALVEY